MLSLIGVPTAVILAAPLIPAGHQVRRNIYPDRAACERDYSPQQCEPDNQSGSGSSGGSGSGSSGGHGSYYHGPYYSADRNSPEAKTDPGPGRTAIRTATETSVRGGFGAFGRAVHAVG
jgi:hypothetical protein